MGNFDTGRAVPDEQELLIGIDIGTTTVCGVLFDNSDDDSSAVGKSIDSSIDKSDIKSGIKSDIKSEGKAKGKVVYSLTERNTGTYSVEELRTRDDCKGIEDAHIQDPEKILGIAKKILDSLIEYADGLSKKISAIGVTGQMHGIVYVDDKGIAVSPLYTWQDQRGAMVRDDDHKDIPAGYGTVTDYYNYTNGLIPEEAAAFCSISSYVAMRLADAGKPKCHPTEAAAFGGYDIERKCFKKFVLDTGRAPEIAGEYDLTGEYKGIKVSVGIGDNQAAFLGSVGFEAECGTVLVNVGTGSQVAVLTDDVSCNAGSLEKRPYFDNRIIAVGSALCGGRAYAVLADFFSEVTGMENAYELMMGFLEKDVSEKYLDEDDLIEDALICDTRFAGTRENKDLRGSIKNISISNFTPGALVKGVLNGIVNELFEMFDGNGFTCERLVGSGNGIRLNPYLAKLFSAKFGRKIEIPVYNEEAAAGAAIFAGKATQIRQK